MPRSPLQAWFFDLDEGVEIVFARSEAGARAIACRHSGCSWAEQEIRRCACFDRYGTRTGQVGVSDSQRYQEGWPVVCAWCEHRLTNAGEVCERCNEDCEDAGLALPIVVDGDVVYCTRECRRKHLEQWERQRQLQATARQDLLDLCPFVEVTGSSSGGPAGCQCFAGNQDNVLVFFKVPGGDLTGRTSQGNHYHNVFCAGCGTVWVARGDLEAFRGLQEVRPDLIVEGLSQ